MLWTYFETSVRLLLGDHAHPTVLLDTLDFDVWLVWHYEAVLLRSMKNLLTDHTNLS